MNSRRRSSLILLSALILLSHTGTAFLRSDNDGRRPEERVTTSNSLFDVTQLEHLEPPAAVPGPKTVLVTGAAGFVGSHVAEFLLKRGDSVIVLDEVNDYYDVRIKESNLELLQGLGGDKVKIVRGDICNAAVVRDIFEQQKPEWVVHLAARAGVRPSILDPFVYIHSNIQGTLRLLEFAVEYKVKNFVMASSSSVYGGSTSTLFDESENVEFPISPYAASKRVTELLATYYHNHKRIQPGDKPLPITALRFFTVYGPRGRPDMAPFKFIDWMARGKPIQQFGDGSSSRDYTYVDDIVQGVVGALDRPTPIYHNVNLGKGSGTSLSQFVEIVAKYVGKKPKIQYLPDQPGDVPYTCANVTWAHVMLNYTPTIPFETGMQKTVEWYKQVFPQNFIAAESGIPQPEEEAIMSSRRRRLQQVDPHRAIPPHEEQKKVLVVAHQESTFFTEHLVNALTLRGDDVAVIIPSGSIHAAALDPRQYSFSMEHKGQVSVHSGCVNNATFLEQVLDIERPLWFLYLNTLSNANDSKQDPFTYVDVNIQAFVRLMELIKKRGVHNLVYTSSTHVYQPTNAWHSESEAILQYSSPYAVSQKGRELFGHTWHHLYKIPMTALRVPALYGPGQCPWCNEDDFDNNAVQEFLYVEDAVDGLILALDRPYPYQIINLGQDPDLVDMVEEACQSRFTLRDMIFAYLKGEYFTTGTRYACPLANISKAKAYLNFAPQVRLRQGIQEVAEWLRQNPHLLPTGDALLVVDRHPQTSKIVKLESEEVLLTWTLPTLYTSDDVQLSFLPTSVEILSQIQWLAIVVFVVYKGVVLVRGSSATNRRST